MRTPAALLEAAGQEHLADAVERLGGEHRARLAAEIDALDLPLIARLVHELVHDEPARDLSHLRPADVVPIPADDAARAQEAEAVAAGEALLARGRVAAVLVAGGQGTRLGFDGPKGAFPFAPLSGRTLFAHHAARIGAIRRRYRCELPWYVMTSPGNDAATRAVFEEADWFGLPPASVRLFVQGRMPAVDRASGRILLEAPDRLALSPDGHGGVFAAMSREGVLADLHERGVTTIATFNVDNPLLRVARPAFIGRHASAGADMSNIVVRKHDPAERVGVVARDGDRTVLVEYSDLPDELARLREPDGTLTFWAGSIAAHAIECAFAERVAAGGGLPFHRAVKAVPHYDPATGTVVRPREPNAVKFETFMFDALPLARVAVSVESAREDEFSPIKNADGADSPETARRDLNRLGARWLRAAGVPVPADAAGDPPWDIEISPGVALDPGELADRLRDRPVDPSGPILLLER